MTAFVPARCGSKSIRLKNIRSFCGRPLLYWCLNALDQAKLVDRVVVATDCQEIDSCVKGFELSKVSIFQRTEANARDQSSTEEVILEYLDKTEMAPEDLLLLVQATTPFSTADDFDA